VLATVKFVVRHWRAIVALILWITAEWFLALAAEGIQKWQSVGLASLPITALLLFILVLLRGRNAKT
jgi:hypothetical protein